MIERPFFFVLLLLVTFSLQGNSASGFIGLRSEDAITPNQFKGNDSQRIQQAIAEAKKKGGVVTIPANNANGTHRWLLDEAILLPSDLTVILDNCTIQLSDSCRDNMFRSDNVGAGIEAPGRNRNIHLIGVGKVVLKGADNPRSTGDGARQLTLDPDAERKKGNWRVSYGSDAAHPERKQKGDWRNIMILIAQVDGFSLKNVRVENSHAWAISFERATQVELSDLDLYNPEEITVKGRHVKVFNKDGIDLRQGCKNFRIRNVRGFTADDFIALSSLTAPTALDRKAGSLLSTMVTKGGWHGPEDDTEQIFISDITCESICRGVAIRASDSASIHHIYITNLVSREASGVGGKHNALLLGGKGYGALSEPGKINHVYLQNVVSTGHAAVMIEAPVADCHFMNVMYTGKAPQVVDYAMEKSSMRNVTETNLVKLGD
jgi:polygalacturonase